MPLLWDIVQPADLTRVARVLPYPQDYLLTGTLNPDGTSSAAGGRPVLPANTIPSFKARIRNSARTVRAAKFRAYNAANYIADRVQTLTITDVVLPPLGQMIPMLERELLEAAISGNDPNGDVLRQIYDDTATNVAATRARMELAAGDVLTDGKFSLVAENGLTLDADWSLASTHKPTAATLWSNGAATPLTDEQTWVQVMASDGGGAPTRAITSLQVINYLRTNSEYIRAFWGPNGSGQPALNLDQVNQVRANYGLPPIVRYDTVIDVDGVSTRPIPVNRFILVNDNGVGETQWGLTAQALQDAQRQLGIPRQDAPGIFSAAYYEEEPVARWSSTHAAGMPVLFDVNKLISATVA